MHGDLVTRVGGDHLAAQLRSLQRARPDAPLARGGAVAVGAGVGEGHGQRLDQVAAAGAHARPEREAVHLRAGRLGEHNGRVGLADPRLGRAQGEGRAEADGVVVSGVGDRREGSEEDDLGGGHFYFCLVRGFRCRTRERRTRLGLWGGNLYGKASIYKCSKGNDCKCAGHREQNEFG